jgi:hypothetical protein
MKVSQILSNGIEELKNGDETFKAPKSEEAHSEARIISAATPKPEKVRSIASRNQSYT